MVVHVCIPSSQEAEAGEAFQFQGQTELHNDTLSQHKIITEPTPCEEGELTLRWTSDFLFDAICSNKKFLEWDKKEGCSFGACKYEPSV